MGGSLAKPESIWKPCITTSIEVCCRDHANLRAFLRTLQVCHKCAVRFEPICAIAGFFHTAPALFFLPHQRSESDADQQSFG
jgi:hypothetical protein